jgi:hypothetical protein
MLLAVLELSDFLIIGVLLILVAGAAASVYFRPADRDRLRRVEHKLDLVMTHLGLDYTPPAKTAWQDLADDPSRRIPAIKAYRDEHGVGLAEAKRAVEDYIEGRSRDG